MKITGYQLREAIKQQGLKRDAAARGFPFSLKAFPGETPEESPQQLASQFLAAEAAIAQLQLTQMRYNLTVRVAIGDEAMPLAAAIKLLGGIARAEKMWHNAAAPKAERYAYSDETRTTDTLVKQPTIRAKEAQEHAISIARRASALRQAIALGNATAVEIEEKDLDGSIFG